ncbi:unnamed protein product, partial [Rotaria sp. Silwood1]
MMKKYQRVLYTSEFTDELKQKLRIVRYDKRKSLKGNVYYIGFSSESDAHYATKLANKLPNLTVKPFQPKTTRISSPKQSAIRFSPSSEFPSLPSTLSYLPPDWYHARSCSQPNKHERTGETLLERGQRLLGLCSEISPSSSIGSNISKSTVHLIERHISPTDNLKRVLIEEIKSCLDAIDCTREAADDFCRFNESTQENNVNINSTLASTEKVVDLGDEKQRSASGQPEHVEREKKVNDSSFNNSDLPFDTVMGDENNIVKTTEVTKSTSGTVKIEVEITDEELLAMALMLEAEMEKQI